jgi:hypothetical protein
MKRRQEPLFFLGQILATPGALAAMVEAGENPRRFVLRHVSGDWGELGEEDRQANDAAVRLGLRVFSAYRMSDGQKLWVITEADRSATTLLLPSEY